MPSCGVGSRRVFCGFAGVISSVFTSRQLPGYLLLQALLVDVSCLWKHPKVGISSLSLVAARVLASVLRAKAELGTQKPSWSKDVLGLGQRWREGFLPHLHPTSSQLQASLCYLGTCVASREPWCLTELLVTTVSSTFADNLSRHRAQMKIQGNQLLKK